MPASQVAVSDIQQCSLQAGIAPKRTYRKEHPPSHHAEFHIKNMIVTTTKPKIQ
jgi:hypothetical protein